MTSAVLDVAVCLLLVAAAVVTVTDARRRATERVDRPDDHAADGTLAVLTTATLTLSPTEEPGRPETTGRTRRGTAAELLSVALVADDRRLRRRVAATVGGLLPPRTAVRVYRVGGETADRSRRYRERERGLRVGPRPPPGPVHAATARLPARGARGRVGLVVRWWP